MGKIVITKHHIASTRPQATYFKNNPHPKQQETHSASSSGTWQDSALLLTLFDEKRPYLMQMTSLPEAGSMLGNIYLARIKDAPPGLSGVFLSVSKEDIVYLSLERCKNLLVANRDLAEGEKPRQGDEIVIQISGEAQRSKQPTATEKLTLAGEYCVCSYWGHGLSYSRKLGDDQRQSIGQAIRNAQAEGHKKYQFTVRTNAGNLEDPSPFLSEMRSFTQIFDTITNTYKHRTCYTCFYEKEAEIISSIKNIPLTAYDEIVTDEGDVYKMLTNAFPDKAIRLYQDDMLSLARLYSIETHLKEALAKKVWLKSGGYLVIEPTEAMVVIDVNSGKAQGKGRDGRDYHLMVNLEAAKEVARQLRLRNYSGMVMVDFISMKSEEDNRRLLERLDAYLREDKVKTRLIDMTPLGVVEITRKKTSRPLSEFFSTKSI